MSKKGQGPLDSFLKLKKKFPAKKEAENKLDIEGPNSTGNKKLKSELILPLDKKAKTKAYHFE